MKKRLELDTYGHIFALFSVTFLLLFWVTLLGSQVDFHFSTAEPAVEQPRVLAETTEGQVLDIYSYPPLVNSHTVLIQGSVVSQGTLEVDGESIQVDYDSALGYGVWEISLQLDEGANQFEFMFMDEAGTQLVKTALVISDTLGPHCNLIYSQSPAVSGILRVQLQCTERITPVPRISIDQRGSVDVVGVRMEGREKNWFYDYTLHKGDGNKYKNGEAKVSILTGGDVAGNPIAQLENKKFTIQAGVVEPDSDNSGSGSSNSGSSDSTTSTDTTTEDVAVSDEVESNTLPVIRIRKFEEEDIDGGKYRPGSLVRLDIEYRSSGTEDIDSRISQYVYRGSEKKTNFTGFYIDFSKLDSNFDSRRVTISDRLPAADGEGFHRRVQYRVSPENEFFGREVNVTIQYFVNGESLSAKKILELKLARKVPEEPSTDIIVDKVNQTNSSEISKDDGVKISQESLITKGIKLQGIGPKNSKLQIKIFSEPLIAEVITDDEGNWEYTVKKELAPGNHTVYAALVSDKSIPQDFTQIFSFEVSAAAIETTDEKGNQVLIDETSDTNVNDDLAELVTEVKDNTPLLVLLGVMVAFAAITAVAALYLTMLSRKGTNDEIIPAI